MRKLASEMDETSADLKASKLVQTKAEAKVEKLAAGWGVEWASATAEKSDELSVVSLVLKLASEMASTWARCLDQKLAAAWGIQ